MNNQIKKIRDILRVSGITDSDSIDHCIAFMALRRLSPELCQRLSIPVKYSFDRFFYKDQEEKDIKLDPEEIYNKFYTSDPKKKSFISYLRTRMGFKSFKFKDDLTNTQLCKILSILKTIDVEKLSQISDIVGDIYEMHLKSGAKSSSRDLGQFFTNRQVIKFMVNMVQPVVNDQGLIETIVDPTMGTGGFLASAIEYLNNKYDLDWNLNQDRIFGFDISSSVRDYAYINLLLETGHKFSHLLQRDTLSNDICVDESPISCDIILANEPMGIDVESVCPRIQEVGIPGTNAEPAFLQLFGQALNKNGRCAVIVPDGVLFGCSIQHKKTRQYLLENFDLREIVKMSGKNFFMNTRVATSIIYFCNPGYSTTEVKFSEIFLDKKTDQIHQEFTCITSIQDIRDNNFDLTPGIYKELAKRRMDTGLFSSVCLGDIAEIKKGTELSKEKLIPGIYKVFGGGVNHKGYHNVCNRQGGDIVLARVGQPNVSFQPESYFLTNGGYAVRSTDEKKFLTKYIYWYILARHEYLASLFKGTAQKMLLKPAVEKFLIRSIPIYQQEEIVRKLDILQENNISNRQTIDQLTRKITVLAHVDNKEIRPVVIKDYCDVNLGKVLSKRDIQDGPFPVIGGGILTHGYHTKSNRKENTIVLSRIGSAKMGYITEPFFLTKSCVSIEVKESKKKSLDPIYLYCYLLGKKRDLDQLYLGTAQKIISKPNMENISILVPDMEIQKKIVQGYLEITEVIISLKNQIEENNVFVKEIFDGMVTEENGYDEELIPVEN